MRTCCDRTDARLARRATRAKKDDSRGTTGVSRGAFPPRDLPLPKPRVNFNTTDATTGATSPNMIQGVGEYVHAPTALLLPAQNNDTHRMSNRLAPISGHDGMVGSRGKGGFPIQIGGGFLYNTYPYVSCMYPACILKDTCIPNVS